MQVRLQTQVGERIEERRRQVPGLERRKSQSLDSGVSQQALHELGEIGIAVKIVAVRAQVHAAQHGLPVAELDKPAYVFNHRVERPTAPRTPRHRNDAEGAAVIATVLHLHESTRPLCWQQKTLGRVCSRHRVAVA